MYMPPFGNGLIFRMSHVSSLRLSGIQNQIFYDLLGSVFPLWLCDMIPSHHPGTIHKGPFTHDVRIEARLAEKQTIELIACVSGTVTGGTKTPKILRTSNVNGPQPTVRAFRRRICQKVDWSEEDVTRPNDAESRITTETEIINLHNA